jgi:hypothetical protein
VLVLFPKTRRRYGQACLTDVAVADAPNVISMLITVIGQRSCYFSSRPLLSDAPTSLSLRDSPVHVHRSASLARAV